MNMKKNFNKTANSFLKVMFYIIRNCNFTIDEIIDYMSQEYGVSIKYLTILKYLRTMKKLHYKFDKEKNVYRLISCPFKIDIKDEEITDFFGKYLKSMNEYDCHAQKKAEIIYSKISPFLKMQNIHLLDKKYHESKNKEKKKYAIPKKFINICEEKMRVKIKYNKDDKNYTFIIEPNKIVNEGGEYFIYGFNLKNRVYELFNIKYIISIESLHQKNKYQYKKETALLQLTGNLANSYTRKKGENLIQKNKDGIIIMTHFYDRELFFKRILRYQTSCKIVAPKFLQKEYLTFIKSLYTMYICPHV